MIEIIITWLIIGIIIGYKREEVNRNLPYNRYDYGILMCGSIIAAPLLLLFAIIIMIFIRPWEKGLND